MKANIRLTVARVLNSAVIVLLLGMGLFLYNDYRDSQLKAATEQLKPGQQTTVTDPDPESVDGVVELGPEGIIRPNAPAP